MKEELERKLHFLRWAKIVYISALEKRGLHHLLNAVNDAHAAAFMKLSTPKLTRALIEATTRQLPPRAGGGRPKMRYAHQGGQNPPGYRGSRKRASGCSGKLPSISGRLVQR